MRLRHQIILIFLVAISATLLVEVSIMMFWINNKTEKIQQDSLVNMNKIQEQYAQQYLSRVHYALQQEGQSLLGLNRQYSSWNLIRDAVLSRNTPIIEDNFHDSSLGIFDIDFVLVRNVQGEVVFNRIIEKGSDESSRRLTPQEVFNLGLNSPMLNLSNRKGSLSIIPIRRKVLLLVSLPIFDNDGLGEAAGTLLIGRFLDKDRQALLSTAIQSSFLILDYDDPNIPTLARKTLTGSQESLFWMDSVKLNLPRDLLPENTDIYGILPLDPVPHQFILRIIIPTELLIQERVIIETQDHSYREMSFLYIGNLVLSNIALALLFLFLLKWKITKRINEIEKVAHKIGLDPDHSRAIPISGSDELTDISISINSMLGVLEQRRNELVISNQILKESNRTLQLRGQALRESLLPVVITDASLNILSVNISFCRVYEYTEEEVLGKTPVFLDPGAHEYEKQGIGFEEYCELYRDLKESLNNPARLFWEGTLYNKKKDGSVIPTQIELNPIYDNGILIGYVAWIIDLSKRIQAEEEVRIEVYQALSKLAEKRDSETGLHIKRIGIGAATLSSLMGLTPHFIKQIGLFAPLHDIGKVGIQDSILLSTNRLNADEFKIMSTHTNIGHSILADRKTMQMASEIAYCHHEHWDGSGYPQGLSGEEIPFAARIVTVVDIYDALRNRRPYKEPWSHEDTIAHMVSQTGIIFDPSIAQMFFENAALFEEIYRTTPI